MELRKIIAVLSVPFACVLAGPVAAQKSSPPNINRSGEIRYLPGRLLVQPNPGLSLAEFDKKLKVHGATREKVIPKINVHIVRLPANANAQAVAKALNADAHIKFAEVDQQVPPSLTPNDPDYSLGWHLPQINAPIAWDTTAGDGVTIAILDSGVDASHPDLAASLVAGWNAYDNNSDTTDVYGHGTKVAGAAAMVGNNLLGGTGVAFNAKIMPVRVTDTAGYGYYSAMANGLVWAADHGARVANISFLDVCGSSTVLSAAQYMRNKGGVVTVSAGNTGVQESIAPSDSVVCVSATDSTDVIASWSSYGSYVDVAAPGVGIYTTTSGGGYGSVSGTSFSAPVTAGVYALMMAANSALSPGDLDAALFSTAVDLGAAGVDMYYGYGRVDAGAAVAKARAATASDTTAPSVVITAPAASSSVNGWVSVDVTATDNVGVTQVDLYAGGSLVASDVAPPYSFSWDSSFYTWSVLLEAKARDAAGNVGSASVTVNVATTVSAPSVAIVAPQSGAVVTGTTAISVSASDVKRVASITLTIDGKQVAQSFASTLNYSWNPYGQGVGQKRKAAGSHSISATATNDAGLASSTSVSVTVQ